MEHPLATAILSEAVKVKGKLHTSHAILHQPFLLLFVDTFLHAANLKDKSFD